MQRLLQSDDLEVKEAIMELWGEFRKIEMENLKTMRLVEEVIAHKKELLLWQENVKEVFTSVLTFVTFTGFIIHGVYIIFFL